MLPRTAAGMDRQLDLRAPLLPRAPRMVAIGGGTGLPTVLRGLRQVAHARAQADVDVTAVVTVMDDGGSSGELRQSLGVLPPGDIRNCLAALAREHSPLCGILHDRLAGDDGRAGHPIGNLILAALTTTEGNLLRAIQILGAQMNICGRVLPATLESAHLTAAFEDGGRVCGESAITARGGRIRRLMLDRPVRPLPEVIDALAGADLIVVGPGSLYTSILPNLLVDGVAAAIAQSSATRVCVANLMTQPGETDGYSLDDHLRAIREHTGFDLFDYVLVNGAPICPSAIAQYAAEGSRPVRAGDVAARGDRTAVVSADLATVTPAGQIRHDPVALGLALHALAGARQPHPVPFPRA